MATNPEFGRRAREARRRWTLAHDRELPFAEIGRLVAESIGRATPYSHQAVRKWFADGQEPDSWRAAAALARVLDVDQAWLMLDPDGPTAAPASAAPDGPRHGPLLPAVEVPIAYAEGESPHAKVKAEKAAKAARRRPPRRA